MALRSAFHRLRLTRSWRVCVTSASRSSYPLAATSSSLHLRCASFSSNSSNESDSAISEHTDPSSSIPEAHAVTETVAQSADVTTTQIISETAADYLQAFHNTVSFDILPWTATIPMAALALRLVSFPLLYYNQIHAGRFMLASKEFPRIQYFVRNTPGSLFQKYVTFRRLRKLALRSAGTSQLRLFRWHMVVHLPLMIVASMGMRELARRVPDEWRGAGIGWISDLTASDPMGILPIVTTGLWLWNLDPKSMPTPRDKTSERQRKAMLERIMSGTGDSLARMFQVIAVVSLSVTTELPAGIVLFWFSNGVMTGVQRYALSNDVLRRRLGLLTVGDFRAMQGPPVIQSTGVAVEKLREELVYIQREVLSAFQERRVDEKLCREVNKMLERERWSGRISVDLKAVVREDDREGKKYVAIVRSG